MSLDNVIAIAAAAETAAVRVDLAHAAVIKATLIVFGLGTSIRFRPRTAFIAEFLPRVAGYRPDNSRHGLSFGLQHATNGHVFELTLSNSLGTTTNGAFIGGGKDFSLRFNLYRRLH